MHSTLTAPHTYTYYTDSILVSVSYFLLKMHVCFWIDLISSYGSAPSDGRRSRSTHESAPFVGRIRRVEVEAQFRSNTNR